MDHYIILLLAKYTKATDRLWTAAGFAGHYVICIAQLMTIQGGDLCIDVLYNYLVGHPATISFSFVWERIR